MTHHDASHDGYHTILYYTVPYRLTSETKDAEERRDVRAPRTADERMLAKSNETTGRVTV